MNLRLVRFVFMFAAVAVIGMGYHHLRKAKLQLVQPLVKF